MSTSDIETTWFSSSRRLLSNLVLPLTALFVARVLYRILDRLLWHPLASFPGPRLAAVSRLYQAYYDVYYDGKFVVHLHDLHKKYGPVVRISPNELHFSTPEAYKDIYHHGSKLLKDEELYDMFGDTTSVFGTWDPVFHRKRRDTMNPLFSRRAILKLESNIREKGDRLIEVIGLSKGGPVPVDLYSAFRSMSLDVIYDYVYGEDAGAIAYPSFKHPILADTEVANHNSGVQRHISIILGRLGSLPEFIRRRIALSTFPELLKLLESRATEFHERKAKAQQSDEKETILGRIVELENPSYRSLVEESQTLTFAGSDTVANTCFMGCFHVYNDKEMRKKVLEELKNVWPDSSASISYEVLEKLPYLTAIIKESLRVSHGVPVGLPREVQPTSAQIGGYEVPRGAIVSMGATFMHWNPKIFPEPHKFSPDRWLQDDSRELANYLVPFSRGPRQCIGINLAWCEMYIILGNMFRKLDIEIQDMTIEDMQDMRFHFVTVLAGKKHLWGVVKDLVD